MNPTPEQVAQWSLEHGELIFGTKSKESWVFSKQALENLVTRAMSEQAEQDAKAAEAQLERWTDARARYITGECAAAIRANAPKVTT